MIGLPRGVEVYLYSEPCDMRRSFNTLAAVVTGQMKRDVLSGELFVFVSRDQKRAKVLHFDGTGMCLYAKRMEQGRFVAPWKMRKAQLTLSELALFIEGAQSVREKLSPSVLRKADLKLTPTPTEELFVSA
jgi:transposase